MTLFDPFLPGFEMTWDTGFMLDVLNERLNTDRGAPITSIELDRIRHRPGSRGIVQYVADIGGMGEHGKILIAGSTYADGRAAVIAEKLRRRGAGGWGPIRGLSAYDARLDMVFQIFPLDRRLPGLLQIVREGMAPLIESMGMERDAVEIRPVRHRLGLAATVAVRSGETRRYVKFHPAGGMRESFRLSQMFGQRAGDHVSTPAVSMLGDFDATVTDHVEGAGPGVGGADARWRVGQALARVHACSGSGPDRFGAAVERARRGSTWLRATLPPEIEVPDLPTGDDLEGAETTLVHGDLKPEHVVIGADDVTLLDLDSAGAGRPLSDLATLLVRMSDGDAAGELMEAYRASSSRRLWTTWHAEWALASVALAHFHARRRRSGWQEEVAGILGRPPVG